MRGTVDVEGRFAAPMTAADLLAQATGDPATDPVPIGEIRSVPNLPARIRTRLDAGLRGTSVVDPSRELPDPRLIAQFGAENCLKFSVLPWQSCAGRVTILAASSEEFLRAREALRAEFGPVHFAYATQENLNDALCKSCHKALMHNAEKRTRALESCRNWNTNLALRWGLSVVCLIGACLIFWPVVSFSILCGWAVFTLILNTILKVTAAVLHLRSGCPSKVKPCPYDALPIITILVPLFRERDIAGALVRRLSALDYPSEKLDVCLVLEADDGTTQDALAAATLPLWMRAIKVPLGTLQTKPRALNYALSFARGSIIGVYDAEDAPAPDQLHVVAARFEAAEPDVACLQGRLDFYNSHSNWLARCFTIEYATWFHIILPGLERLKLAIPLGGTTLFFRRDILEELGGWDAHNVTEDADLGIRLTRHGYRTEIIDTTTQEEANARAWPWIKQRSRWLKGYAITYGVHMRNPITLWNDLGAWRFFGVQLLFAGSALVLLAYGDWAASSAGRRPDATSGFNFCYDLLKRRASGDRGIRSRGTRRPKTEVDLVGTYAAPLFSIGRVGGLQGCVRIGNQAVLLG